MNKQSKNKKGSKVNTLLTAGFGEDDYVCGVFLIEAKAKKTFLNRKQKLENITGFTDGLFDSYEEDEDGGIWKLIVTAWFENMDELKKAMKKMKKYNWLFFTDSSLMLDDEYLYVDGRWTYWKL